MQKPGYKQNMKLWHNLNDTNIIFHLQKQQATVYSSIFNDP